MRGKVLVDCPGHVLVGRFSSGSLYRAIALEIWRKDKLQEQENLKF